MQYFRAIFLCLLIASPAFASDVPPSFADLVEKLSPAVVNVSTTQKVKGGLQGDQLLETPDGMELPEEFRDFFNKSMKQPRGSQSDREVYSLGSGFIIDENGYIATNNHVIADAEEITIILSDDTKLKAKIIGRDAKTDLALLKVDAGKKLPYVALGDSDISRVGDWVIAIGNPFGLGGTVTAGIISARARNINAGPFDDFIQTDAAINRGNSGGPMFNMKGEVIGINTAIFSPSGGSVGIGFALPTSLAKPVLTQLKATGHIDRGWLGVKIQTVTDEIADSVGLKKVEGALVMEATKDSPADKAGIKSGDIITHFDGKEVKEMRNLPLMVAQAKIGSTVAVEIWRKGESKVMHVTLAKLNEKDEADSSEDKNTDENTPEPIVKTQEVLGMALAYTVTPELRDKYGIAAGSKGTIIMKINPGSEALKRGLQPGDLITQVGETVVSAAKDVSDAVNVARLAGRKFVLVRIERANESMFITLPVEQATKN